jgi:inorganic pyrophosphatase
MKKPEFHEWRPHPWHGLEAGRELPICVNSYIEITPFDLIKYEVDKASGYLRVDRPQRTSSQPPALYGFVPKTFCGISERPIQRSEIIVPARVVGGLQLLDRGEADDKLIAVLEADFVWGAITGLAELPQIAMQQVYVAEHAGRVVTAAIADYKALARS